MNKNNGVIYPRIPFTFEESPISKPQESDFHKYEDSSKAIVSQIISPVFFNNQLVSVLIKNEETKQMVEDQLNSVGAIIVPSSKAKLIISESQIIQPPDISFASTRFRRSRTHTSSYLANEIIQRSQKNVLLSQIPWSLKSETSKSKPKKADTKSKDSFPIFTPPEIQKPIYNDNILIISDITKKFRPMIYKIGSDTKLYIGHVPKNYPLTPFEPIPPNLPDLMVKYQNSVKSKSHVHIGMPKKGYCSICQKYYENAEMHHQSFMHQNQANKEEWKEFDDLAIDINREFIE